MNEKVMMGVAAGLVVTYLVFGVLHFIALG